jgi:hypothetical protein
MWNFSGSGSASYTTSSASGSGSETSSLRRLSAADEELVKSLTRQFASNSTADTAGARAQAIRDVQGSIENLFKQNRESFLPQILSKQNRAGGYNSTTGQLLSNDAFARTVAQGQALMTDTITKYENTALAKSAQALQGFQTSLAALLQAQQTSQVDNSFKTKSSSTTAATSISGGWG